MALINNPTWRHVTDGLENSDVTLITNTDVRTCVPLTVSARIRVATVLGLICRESPTLADANSTRTPPGPMYSLLIHAMISDPLVSQVKLITSPEHTNCLSVILLLMVTFAVEIWVPLNAAGCVSMISKLKFWCYKSHCTTNAFNTSLEIVEWNNWNVTIAMDCIANLWPSTHSYYR